MKLPSLIVIFVSMVTVWSPGATQDLPAINPDNLDPDAAHVCQTTETESYTIRKSFTQYYKQKTSTWCFAVPPRCTEYRIASRTAYKIETRYRNRKNYFCCTGYKAVEGLNYCVPACDHDCYSAKEQGYCVTPGKCKCYPGYKGTYCESGCESNQWGPDCTKTCNCGTHGSCDPENGNCICHIGYTGQTCSQKCVDSFGLHCVHPCACENDAICDHINGKCTCKHGWYGAYCHKKCDSTTAQEEGCEQECPCQNGGVCIATTGVCICPSGVKGQYCTEMCDAFHWGVNCTEKCTCNFGKCNPKYGTCTCDHGYAGDSCQVKCPDGFYGAGCLTPCGCKNEGKCYRNADNQMVECNCDNTGFHGDVCSVRDCPDGKYVLPGSQQTCQNCTCDWRYTESCHPLTGTCSCKPGYTGNQCTEKCSMPFYGKDCLEVCGCAHGNCDHVTGNCSTCYPGYIGANCDQECKQGTWGMDCVNNCTCLNGAKCHVKSGYCECKPGYAGINCETYCEVGRYGQDCMGICNCDTKRSSCSPVNGQCLCKPGFMGEKCDNTCKLGTYGYYCISECACSSEGTKSCDSRTGFCYCKGGWSGKLCDRLCSDSNWGPNCMYTCNCNGNGNCHGDTGDCICYNGYSGKNCEYKDGVEVVSKQTGADTSSSATSMTPLIVGIVVPCIILLLILALVVAYYMRKVRSLKEENLRVHYEANGTLPGHTVIPNGNAAGVVNPTYVEDNARNERRYPHLSQRVSAAPPPLPHRQQSCDPCDDIDVEKLRVQINSSGTRPVSSQYADIDDVEDRYTTLKSMAGASNIAADSKSDTLSEGQRSRSSSKTSEGSFGFSNKGYVDMEGTAHSTNSTDQSNGGFSQPLYDNNEQSANKTNLDQPDALSSIASADTDQNPTGQASKVYDFPKSTRLSSIGSSDQEVNHSLAYTNSISHPSLESQDTKNKRENPYDTPNSSLPKISENANRSTAANGYLTPQNDINSSNSFA